MNIDMFTPTDFGPALGGVSLLGDLRLSLLGNYSAGSYFTWTGGGGSQPLVTGIGGASVRIEDNVQWRSYYNLDVRISKSFRFSPISLELFVDIGNALNIKYFSSGGYGFKDGNDFDAYMRSLHLPSGVGDVLELTVDVRERDAAGNITGGNLSPTP